jgi:hypothetical protein
VKLRELARAAAILDIDDPRIAPGGPIAPFVGPQLGERQVAEAYAARVDGVDELPPSVLRSIRSFPVPALAGERLTCERDRFTEALNATLARRLPGIQWPAPHLPDDGLVEKYHLLDGAYPAPADPATGQAMLIELGGGVAAPDGPLGDGEPLPRTIVVTIDHAHWCNVSGLGVGVGFYM